MNYITKIQLEDVVFWTKKKPTIKELREWIKPYKDAIEEVKKKVVRHGKYNVGRKKERK